ncbi:gliding motility lipoprotein GldH [Aquimarina brevivitae]|uniref:Protein involved in gliding motility GldH n=1 Tax=Aquimarina brevivitae TaxID=323412 RepID=A0A4Q7PGY6_9FLAO|nr:gliding motility lipoprotein GldH [Aquimarina brevivitae]RZS99188.1 protein involved in gliding motility GldH [Aquimarina brevivitae]
MIKSKLGIALCTFLVFQSCDRNSVYDSYKTVSQSWEKSEVVEFKLPQLDSTATYNLFINIRNNNNYPYSNLFLISAMEFPNGKIVTDTLEYEMAAPNGEWLGTGFSDLKENKLWYKEKVRFVEQGTYKVTIQHAMRNNGEVLGVNSLEGITDIGFRIENASKPNE